MAALDALKNQEIVVPVWDETRGQGASTAYKVSGFARIELISYSLPGQNKLTAIFLGFANCGVQNVAPIVDAGSDLTVDLPNSLTLAGNVQDDGLPENGGLTVQWTQVSGPGTATFNNNTSLNAVVTFELAGTYVLSLTASDGEIATSDSLIVTVNQANREPLALEAVYTLAEDSSTNIVLQGNDPDNNSLTFYIVTPPSFGSLSGTPPNVSYQPLADYFGPDSFSFKVSDGLLESAPAVVAIEVSAVNDAPVAESETFETDEDMAIAIVLSAADLEGSALAYSIVNAPAHGSLSGTLPFLSYTPATNFNSSDSFTFKVNDGELGSETETITINILPSDDAPEAFGQLVTLSEDGNASIELEGFDVELAELSFEILETPQHGTLSGTAPNVLYVPLSNYFGPDSFSFKVNDGTLDSSAATVVLNVETVNDAPLAASQVIDVLEDVPFNLTLTGSDVESAVVSFTITTQPTNGILSGTPPHLIYVPNANFNGVDSFEFVAQDGLTNSAPALVTINVQAVNDAPAGAGISLGVIEDEALTFVLAGSDIDGDVLQYEIVMAPGHGTLSGDAPNLAYLNATNYFGSDSFSFRIFDGQTYSETFTAEITIEGVNDAPVAVAGIIQTQEDSQIQIVLGGVDPDGDIVTFEIINTPANGVLSGVAPNLTYTPQTNFYGSDTLTFRVGDGVFTSEPVEISIFIISVNDAPIVFAGADAVVNFPGTVTLQESALDDAYPVGSTLQALWSKQSGPGEVTFGNSGQLGTSAGFSEAGTYILTLSVSDSVATSSDTVKIEVNWSPEVSAGSDFSVLVTNSVQLSGSVEDDGLPTGAGIFSAWTKVSGPEVASFVDANLTNTAVIFSQAGVYQLQLIATDGSAAAFDEVVVTVHGPGTNQPPVVNAGVDQQIGRTNVTQLNGTVLDDSFIGSGIVTTEWTVVTGAGAVSFGDSLAPATTAEFSAAGTYLLRLTANDGELLASDEVIVTIYPDNQPPVVDPGPNQIVVLPATILTEPGATNTVGKIIANHDDWTLSDVGFANAPSAAQFARNIANWFTGGTTGRFLVYSAHFTLNGAQLLNTLTNAGHQLVRDSSQNFSLTNLLTFDGIFLTQRSADNQVLIDYVKAGGNVYLAGGSAVSGEAELWRVFLNAFGLSMVPVYNGVVGTYPVNSIHPIFEGVDSLYYASGNTLFETLSGNPYGDILLYSGTNGLIGVATNYTIPFELSGRISDDGLPAGSTITSQWEIASGPTGAAFNDASSPVTGFGVLYPGIYELRLTGSDGELSASNTVTVTVLANQQPQVDAGADQTNHLTSIFNLSGSVQDDGLPQNVPLFVNWSKVSGPGIVRFGDDGATNSTVTFTLAGTYVLRLTAEDSQTVGSDDVTIVVTGPNAAPAIVQLANATIILPTNSVVFSANVTDDGQPFGQLSYMWNVLAGPGPVIFGTPLSSNTTVFVVTNGTYRLRLTVSDGQLSSTNDVFLFVNPVGTVSPQISAGNDQVITLPERALLTGRVIHNGLGNLVQTFWSKASGPGTVTFGNNGAGGTQDRLNTAAFSAAGTYVLRFRVASSQGTLQDDLTVVVEPGSGAPPTYPGNEAPVVSAGEDILLELPNNIAQLNGVMPDDGLPFQVSSYWLKVSGPGAVIFENATNAFTQAQFTTPGTYVLQLTASDYDKWSSNTVTVTVQSPVNAPPVVNAGPDLNVTLGEIVILNGSVNDDGLPNGGGITALWSRQAGPSGTTTFTSPQSPVSGVIFSVAGTYVLRLTASDTAATGADTVTIIVAANAPPAINPTFLHLTNRIPNTLALPLSVTDDGRPHGIGLSTLWNKMSGLGVVTFLEPRRTNSSVVFSDPGNYVLRLSATDGQLVSTRNVSVVVLAATNRPPVVEVGPDQEVVIPDVALLTRTVSDDGLPAGSLSGEWSMVSGPSAISFSLSNGMTRANFGESGEYVARFTVTDGAFTAFDELTINVTAPPPPPPYPSPIAYLTGPEDSAYVTSPTDILGAAYSEHLANYVLQYRLQEPTAVTWTTFATGHASVSNNVLGVFDPTMVLNGIYEIRVIATDESGRTATSAPLIVIVDRNLKIGHFTLSFSDLTVPVAGIPIEIIRTYDSREKRQGDFGAGWTLDIRNIRLQKNRSLGRNYDSAFVGGYYFLDSALTRQVTITFPGDKVYKFTSKLSPTQQFGYPIGSVEVTFTNAPGTYGTLEIDGENRADVDGYIGGVNLIDFAGFNIFNPTRFKFTTAEGDVYIISQEQGVESMEDRNGNKLTITTNGIFHSSGRSVTFNRDAQGRIYEIVDPAGKKLSYTYDSIGNLETFSDRQTNITTFAYTNATFPHYFTEIIDPRGFSAIRTEYDENGRMVKQTDASGNEIEFTHAIDQNSEIIRTAWAMSPSTNMTSTVMLSAPPTPCKMSPGMFMTAGTINWRKLMCWGTRISSLTTPKEIN